MAILSEIVCEKCHQRRMVNHSASAWPPLICDECKEKQDKSERAQHLEALAKLTIEERLAQIEAALYDMSRPRPPYWDGRIG